MKRRFKYSLSEMTRRLFALAEPIRGYLAISTLASLFGNLGHMGLMGFGAMFILSMAGTAQGSPAVYGALTVLSAVLIPVCRYLEGVFSHLGAYGILAKMRVHFFEKINLIAPACLVDRRKGDLVSIAVSDIETLEYFFAHTIGPMFTVILLPVAALIVAASYGAIYFWVLLPMFLTVSVVLPLIAMKTGRGFGMRFRENLGGLNSLILESVYGIRDIQIFGHGQARLNKVLEQNDRVNHAAHGLTLHRQTVTALPNFFVYLARIFVLIAAAYAAKNGNGDPVGAIVVSFVAAASFSSSFSLTFVVTHLLEAFAAAERLFTIEDTQPAVRETQTPAACGDVEEIRFSDVTFRYPGTDTDILRHADLKICKGEKIGILGESGAGKSTILRLLLRFYDPNSGTITINSIDTKSISMKELHTRIAMLEQETYLFDASIADNIALAKPGASEEEIRAAAKRASLDDFIQTLPDGYQTQMGQMQSRLSGGERQRVGIARIMLADPDVIVMDEPTSALDALRERELLDTLHREYQDKTLIIISHRVSTLRDCTRLFRVEDGVLKEIQGTSE